MYYVYILKNQKDRYYVGYTKNVEARLIKHNSNSGRWTKWKGPWKVVYQEEYRTKQEAYRREKQIKSYKGGEAFKSLIG